MLQKVFPDIEFNYSAFNQCNHYFQTNSKLLTLFDSTSTLERCVKEKEVFRGICEAAGIQSSKPRELVVTIKPKNSKHQGSSVSTTSFDINFHY